jgi:DEAD/DEAH box helicase domain-containing protein
VAGYKKIKFHTHENVGYGEVNLPELQMHTSSLWLTVPEPMVQARPAPRPAVIDALRGIGAALHTAACAGLMIDPRDLGRSLVSREEGTIFDPTLFLFDHVPGGVGLASRLFEQRDDLLRRARRLIERCGCDDGCPACIGLAIGPAGALPSTTKRRQVALDLLAALGVAPDQ